MLDEFRRCSAAAGVLAVGGLWVAAGSEVAIGSLVAAAAAYGGVAYLQRGSIHLRLDGLTGSVRALGDSARRRLEPAKPVRPVTARRLPAPAEQEVELASSPNGYGW